MSALIILLIPLVATGLVCIPLPKRWPMGVTVVACAALLILTAQLAWRIAAGEPFVSPSTRAC